MERFDKNGDGSLSLEEFSATPRMQQLEADAVERRFKAMDRNGDGKVDRADMQRREGDRPRIRPGGSGTKGKPEAEAPSPSAIE